jgi:hypothetical protein
MQAKRFSAEQIVAKLREAEKLQAQGLTIPQSSQFADFVSVDASSVGVSYPAAPLRSFAWMPAVAAAGHARSYRGLVAGEAVAAFQCWQCYRARGVVAIVRSSGRAGGCCRAGWRSVFV